jgi:hypothetical protein
MTTIIGISGSLRSGSFNTPLLLRPQNLYRIASHLRSQPSRAFRFTTSRCLEARAQARRRARRPGSVRRGDHPPRAPAPQQ